MAWTSPRSWTNGEVVTASIMDTHVRDNLNAILSSGTTLNSAIITSSITTLGTPMVAGITMTDNIKVEFGTGADSAIYYDGTDTFWDLRQAGTGDLMIALAGSFPSPDADTVHIWKGTAGVVTAASTSGLVLEDASSIYMSFLTPSSQAGGLLFGDESDNDVGQFIYSHSSDRFQFRMAATDRLFYSAGAFAFQEATTISTTTGNLTISTVAGADVLIGDDVSIVYVDGGLNAVGFGAAASHTAHVFLDFPTTTSVADQLFFRFRILNSNAVTIPSGTTTHAGTMNLAEPNLIATGAITNAFTLRIDSAPTEGTNNYALWVDSGITRLDDPIALGGGSTATLGTIGGSGPATAGQNQWLRININGTNNYIPVWQ